MTAYSVSEARKKLSELIDRTIAGDEVVITRRGKVLVELRAIALPVCDPRPVSLESLRWLESVRVGRVGDENAGTLVSRVRDEDWR